jgi:hypothetical protein
MKKRIAVFLAGMCAGVLFVGCAAGSSSSDSSLGGSSNTNSSKSEISAYAGFNDCGAVLDWTKAEMLKRVGPYGLENPQAQISPQCPGPQQQTHKKQMLMRVT